MSSLHDLIKKIQVEKVNLESYVYYNKDTGKIHKISSSNVPDPNYEIIKVSNEEVKPILTGERRTEEFVIVYDLSLKQIRLKEVAFDDSYNTADTMTYLLPVVYKKETANVDLASPLTPTYVGIYVDVWYKELDHLAGQHVWHNNIVYKLKKDQKSNTNFRKTNVEIIVENVKLYDDTNKHLKFDNTITSGDIVLSNNNLFKFNKFHLVNTSDINICQNINNNVWEISTDTNTKQFLRSSKFNSKEKLYFSVTSKYDPNILYRSLEFTVSDLLSDECITIPFKYDIESSEDNVSIYTAKYFETYSHEVINDKI